MLPAGLALLLIMAAGSPAVAATPPAPGAPSVVVLVLYFDNHTNDPSWDVLQKGLADMMVTDLAAVPGLQVVERTRLQALLDEMKLQRSRYFDPATAQRLGKGIGARYAVTGAISAVDPQVRLDVRLIEVATAKVVMADKVVGTKDRFFELEARLAETFAKALNVRFGPARSDEAGSADLDTVLAYSRGLDQADRGDLAGASKALAQVLSRSPRFRLAKDRYAEVVQRLSKARQKREETLSSGEEALLARLREVLSRPATLQGSERDVATYLGYRVLQGQYHSLALGRAMGLSGDDLDTLAPRKVPPERKAAAAALVRAYVDNTRTLADEMRSLEQARGRKAPNGNDFRVDDEDVRRAEALGIDDPGEWTFATSFRVARALAEFLMLGKLPFWTHPKFQVQPAPAMEDASYRDLATTLLDDALAGASRIADEDLRRRESVDILDTHALGLMRLGRTEDAILHWQMILDQYPTHERYAEFERAIQEALGASSDDPTLQRALAACDPSQLAGAFASVAIQRSLREGPTAFDAVLEQVEARCASDSRFAPMKAVFYFSAAQVALTQGGCDFARRAQAKLGRGQTAEALAPQLQTRLHEACP